MGIFDVALEKRFDDSDEILLIDVSGDDVFLIKDVPSGLIMKLPLSTLVSALATALSSSFEPPVTAGTSAQYYRGDKVFATLNKAAVGLSNVDNTSDADKPVSTAQAASIATKEPTIAAGTTAQYWRGDKAWSTLDKTAVGLSNVDNTSDAGKPVSTAQAASIATKEATIAAGTTAQYWRGDKSFQTLNSTAVGLGNVNNTSDANKPVSTAQAAAIALKADAALPANTAPTLSGSWVNYGSPWQVAGYYKDAFGLVRLTGLVKLGSGVIFVLPAGFRPMGDLYFAVTGAGAAGSIYIEAATGNVNHSSGSTAYISLDGICFRTT